MADNTPLPAGWQNTNIFTCCTALSKAIHDGKIVKDDKRWLTISCTCCTLIIKFCPFCGTKLPRVKPYRARIKNTQEGLFKDEN